MYLPKSQFMLNQSFSSFHIFYLYMQLLLKIVIVNNYSSVIKLIFIFISNVKHTKISVEVL
jgi:hypothetical protein